MCLCSGFFPPLRFYRPERKQAPKYLKALAGQNKCECARPSCRGTIIDDTPEARAAHIEQHHAGPETFVCGDCGEDVCAAPACRLAHLSECDFFQSLSEMSEQEQAR